MFSQGYDMGVDLVVANHVHHGSNLSRHAPDESLPLATL